MAENDPNNQEEYKFDDMDLLASEPEDAAHLASEPSDAPVEGKPFAIEFTPVMRNSLIAIGCLVLLVILYQLVSALLPHKKTPSATQIAPMVATKPFTQPALPNAAYSPPPPAQVLRTDATMTNQLSALEQEQRNTSASVSSMGGQLNGLSTNLEALSNQVQQLNGLLGALNDKMAQQAEEINHWRQMQQKAARHTAKHRPLREQANYALQAVIPGRAWLIGENNITVTVREGTLLPGYGVVKMIDAQRGRVLTSSGRIIGFSQADS